MSVHDTDGWNTVERKKRARIQNTSRELVDSSIRNYYGPLAFMNNGESEDNADDDNVSGIEKGIAPQSVTPTTVLNKKRPNVLVSLFPERERVTRKVKVVPGLSKYSEAHRFTTAIVSDSMVGSLRNNVLNAYVQGDEKVVVGKKIQVLLLGKSPISRYIRLWKKEQKP